MIIAVSAGIIEASASRSRSVSAPRTPPPSWTKCSKRARRLSTNPKSPFGSQTTARSTAVAPSTERAFSTCSSSSRNRTRAPECSSRYWICSGEQLG